MTQSPASARDREKSAPNGNNETTFYDNLAINIAKTVSTIAVDAFGKFAALGGKKGLYIVDLDTPNEPTRTLNQQIRWEVNVVEWNPHKERATYIASTANQNTLIWNVDDSRVALQATLQTHTRAVSDLSWSLFDPNILATCSADTYINLWDVRDPKKPIKKESFCGWTAGATQVKWNRKNPMILASAHNGEVRIWDIRKVSSPKTFITAHMAKIYGIDWSYTDEHDLVTCSEDKQVKFWNTTNVRVCKGTLQSGTPILRAKYTPFGHGLVTMPQRTDFSLRLWSLSDFNTPIHQYVGHNDIITSFDWRVREYNGKKEWQLVTWSKDQHLRLWSVDHEVYEELRQTLSIPVAIERKSSVENGMSVSPIEFSPSPYLIKNLAQEFSMLEKKPPKNILIDELNPAERMCVVTVLAKSSQKMRITFPSAYPHSAAPSFQFLPSSTLSLPKQSKVIEALAETANFHVENNRPCLYQCLCRLVIVLKDSFAEEEQPIPSIPISSYKSTSSIEDIPVPRTCGGCFGGGGKFVWFSNSRLYNLSSKVLSQFTQRIRFRTYRDLKTHIQDLPLNTLQTPFTEQPSPFSIYNYFYSSQDIASNPLPKVYAPTQEDSFKSKQSSTKIVVRDLSYLTPLHKTLATMYRLNGLSVTEMCENALEAAKVVERKDLVQVWSVIRTLVDPSVYHINGGGTNMSLQWSNQPMVTQTLRTIFKHYEKLRDVQTLAMLSCVLDVPPQTQEQKGESSEVFKPFRTKSMFDLLKSKEVSKMTSWSFEKPTYYELHRKFYAELLYQWELLDQRAEVVKFLEEPTQNRNFVLSIQCHKCLKMYDRVLVCPQCKISLINCSVCHLGVRNLASGCLVCGHGGHAHHMAKWFETDTQCASGCTCNCIENMTFL